jgi:class 3 adenylate cyclase
MLSQSRREARCAGSNTRSTKLAVILAGDVAGYSRLMGIDEVGTFQTLKAIRRELADPVEAHHGRIVKTTGNGILIEFPSARLACPRRAVSPGAGPASKSWALDVDLSPASEERPPDPIRRRASRARR